MKKAPKSKNGFTLVELLLYVGIMSSLLLSVSVFLAFLLQSRVKNQSIAEVEGQGIHVMQMVTQAIRNAQDISAPSPGASVPSIFMELPGGSSVVFDVSGGTARISEGGGTAVPITNSRVSVSDLTFQNLSRSGTPGIVRVRFTLTAVNVSGKNEYDFSQTFSGSAALRYQ